MSEDLEVSIKALRTAIELEIKGLEAFQSFADQTDNEMGKKVFLQLAKDEIRHKEILEDQLDNLVQGKVWENVDIPKSDIEKLAPKIRKRALETKGESAVGELDALNAALDLERNAMAFFREKAEIVGIPEAKALFLRLAEWEETHYDLINAEIDSINHTGFYFDMWEFKMDGQY
jgi:rubrerythrin